MEIGALAGAVVVRVQADLEPLKRDLGEGKRISQEFDQRVAGGFERMARSAKGAGDSIHGAASRAAAANDNIAGSAGRAALGMDGMAGTARKLAATLGAVAGALSASALTRYADAWSDMQSRVGAAIKDMDAAPALMKRIVDIANASYSPLDQTVEIFSRNVAVLRDLGRNATEAADFTEALNHALVLTATRGERAASVQNALSKAMAVGNLQADGLETVLANGGEVAQALADELGTTVNGLRTMASQGKITGDVIANALITRLDDLRERAGEMPATIGDAFTRIQTNLTAFIGQLDKAAGASETVATLLLALANNIDRAVTYGATAVTMFGTYYVAAMVLAAAKTVTLTGALVALRAALIRTGIGALVVGAGELVYQFGRLVEATGGWGAALQDVGRRAEFLFDAVVWGFRTVGDAISSIWAGAMADILRMTESTFGGILRWFGVSAESMSTAITNMEKRAENMGEAAKLSASIAAGQFARAFESINLPELVMPDSPGGTPSALGEIDKAAKKAAEAYKRIVDGAQDFIAAQRLEAEVLGLTEQAANALRYERDLLEEARRAGIKLTPEDIHGFKALAEAMAEAEERTRFLTEVFDFTKATIKGFFSDLRSGLEEGKGFWEAFADAGVNALQKIADKLIEMALDQMINNLLRSLMGTFNFGGFSFGNTSYFPPAPSGGFHTLAGGGMVSGPGTSISDSIPAWLSDGEFVVRAAAVAQPGVLPLLEAINNGGAAVRMAMGGLARMHAPANTGVQRFAHGGLAQSRPSAQSNAAPSVTVNVQNNTSAQVEVGEPQQNADGSLTIDLIVNELEGRMEASMRGGRLGRAAQQTFVGLQRRTR